MRNNIDPYRILFPLGLLHSVVGTSYWVLHALGFLPYPGLQHAHEMFAGFLLSFAAGFLLTAVPRFTGARTCTRIELSIGVSLSLLTFFIHTAWLTLAMHLFLTVFFFRRFERGNFTPPPHFIFLPVGLALGISSSAVHTLVDLNQIDAKYVVPARLILYSGTLLAFLLGIGAKLISALLGWAALPTERNESVRGAKFTPYIQVFLFIASFGVEIVLNPALGKALRAVSATWIAFGNWKLYQRPFAQGKLPFWIWVNAWLLILGLWIQAFFPSLGVHAAHLTFIMGFGLMIFMVASRVTLAHGGYSLEAESKSKIYAFVAVSVIMAGLTRFTAVWASNYIGHLGYAAITWIFGIGAWGFYFLPKIVRRDSEE